jgi:hypothetical protein
MSASDDIEKSVEASLEEFVNQANAAFAEDFDGWDIAQTTAEVRFFMPVLNVPFRLIFAYDPQRAGVYDNNLQPQKGFSFRFAVGSTF